MSSIFKPWRESSFGTACTGPMPISSGSQPATAKPRKAPSGERPRRSASLASIRMQAEAPSASCEAFPAVMNRSALAGLAGNPADLADTQLRGMETLQTLLEFAQGHPHVTGAGLLEHWRDTETGEHLMKLAQAELVVPEEALESEFRAVIASLAGRRDEQRLSALLEASRQRPLASEEKAELGQLIKAGRTTPSVDKP